MLKQLLPATISTALTNQLNSIVIAERSKAWDKADPVCVEEFKNIILIHGQTEQDMRCAWCTLKIGKEARRTIHRDHIAPKGTFPKWTFEPQNLVLTCECCNSFLIKGTLNTVANEDPIYSNSQFKIVHPYLHNPTLHIAWEDLEKSVIKGISPEGLWTIEKMQLDSPGMTDERMKDYLLADRRSKLSQSDQVLLNDAVGR